MLAYFFRRCNFFLYKVQTIAFVAFRKELFLSTREKGGREEKEQFQEKQVARVIGDKIKFLLSYTGINLKGQSHEKVGKIRLWGESLGPN
jgi:hypothetical protein